MTGDRPTYRVSAIRHGTVIDHLEPRTALTAFQVLAIPPDALVTIGMNLQSEKIGTKDIIKIDGLELTREQVAKIALLGPHATISIIRDYAVVEKVEVKLPSTIEDIVRCPNPSCVTNADAIRTRFDVVAPDPIRLRCHWCERLVRADEVVFGSPPGPRSDDD